MEDEESLKSGAHIGNLANAVEDQVDDLLSDGVVTASVVVGSILLAADQLLGVEQLAVGAGSDLVDDGGLQVNEDCTRNVFSGASFGEEGGEAIVDLVGRLFGGHRAVGLDAMLEAIKFPAGIA